jgi:hypothetical protein
MLKQLIVEIREEWSPELSTDTRIPMMRVSVLKVAEVPKHGLDSLFAREALTTIAHQMIDRNCGMLVIEERRLEIPTP